MTNTTTLLAEESFAAAAKHAAMLRDAGYTHTVRTYDKYGSTAEVYYAFDEQEAMRIAGALTGPGEITTLSGKLIIKF